MVDSTLPVPQASLKKVSDANITIANAASDLAALLKLAPEEPLAGKLSDGIRQILNASLTISETVKGAVDKAR